MFEKKSVIASAILAALVSGIALAEETPTPPATATGHHKDKDKDSCKGKHKGKHHKKGDKDACSGPNGCDGKDKKDAAKPAETAPPAAEKKAE